MVSYLLKWSLIAFHILPVSYPFSFQEEQAMHPYFVSVTEIQHNVKEKTLEISCKIFTDDFEKALRRSYNNAIDLLKPPDKSAMEKIAGDYIKKHLQIVADGKLLQLKFIGYEKEEEAIVNYFEVQNVPFVKKMEITDNILFEYKKEQINLLHVIANGSRKSVKLDNPEAKASFTW